MKIVRQLLIAYILYIYVDDKQKQTSDTQEILKRDK